MKIYIELVFLLLGLLIFVSWKVWEIFSRKRLLKKYSVDDDKSKNGELKQRTIREAEQRTASGKNRGPGDKSADPVRPTKSAGRGVLPKTKPSSSRKNGVGFREFIKGKGRRK